MSATTLVLDVVCSFILVAVKAGQLTVSGFAGRTGTVYLLLPTTYLAGLMGTNDRGPRVLGQTL